MAEPLSFPPAIDCAGLTDTGRVRQNNEDHFVVAALGKSVDVTSSSLSAEALAHRFGSRTAHLLAVADGVGGGPQGDLASERALAVMLGYVGSAADCFHGLDAKREQDLLANLEATVTSVHESLLAEYRGARAVPATTLTVILLVWPRAYLVHVGDSRAYVRRRGRVQRLTNDQTFGQFMASVGAWTDEQAARPGPGSTLASAVGGSEIAPVVGLVDLEPGDSLLLCTDGLYKHVTDEQIAATLGEPLSARDTGRRLIDAALAGGGSDNVTVVVMRSGGGST